MMFKMKLEANMFNSVPIEEFIYPILSEAVKEKYNDTSVMKENPNLKTNLERIDNLVFTCTELQSLLFFLYWNDFLHELIDFKCKIMSEILNEISDPKLRTVYLKKVETLREEKHEETNIFTYVRLPITIFFRPYFLRIFRNGEKFFFTRR